MFNPTKEQDILEDVYVERIRQENKWGDRSSNSGPLWMTILGEEFGECCKAFLEGDRENLRTELIQVAAVAVAAIRSLDDNHAAQDIVCAVPVPEDAGPVDTNAHPDWSGQPEYSEKFRVDL